MECCSYLAVFVSVPFIDKDLHLLLVLRVYREGVPMMTKDSLRSSMEIQMRFNVKTYHICFIDHIILVNIDVDAFAPLLNMP